MRSLLLVPFLATAVCASYGGNTGYATTATPAPAIMPAPVAVASAPPPVVAPAPATPAAFNFNCPGLNWGSNIVLRPCSRSPLTVSLCTAADQCTPATVFTGVAYVPMVVSSFTDNKWTVTPGTQTGDDAAGIVTLTSVTNQQTMVQTKLIATDNNVLTGTGTADTGSSDARWQWTMPTSAPASGLPCRVVLKNLQTNNVLSVIQSTNYQQYAPMVMAPLVANNWDMVFEVVLS